MSYQSFIRQCQAGQGWLKGGSIVYTVYDTEQGVMIGVLDGREELKAVQALKEALIFPMPRGWH